MESTELTIRLIILFIPGIIETFVYEICENKDYLSDRSFVINAVLSAFVTYSFTYVIFKLLGGGTSFLDALLDSSVKISVMEIMVASGLAIVLGFLEAQLVKAVMTLNRRRNEKYRKVRMSVWDDLFDEDDGYDGHVRIILKDQGIIYEGYVSKYSASVHNKIEVYMKDVTKYDIKTGNELQHDISGIYLQIKDDEDVVMEMIR